MTLADIVASALRGGHVSRRTFNSAAVSSGLALAASSLAARAEVFGPSYLMEEEFDGLSGPAMIFRPNIFEPAGYVVEEFYDSFNALRNLGLNISPTRLHPKNPIGVAIGSLRICFCDVRFPPVRNVPFRMALENVIKRSQIDGNLHFLDEALQQQTLISRTL